MANNAVRVSDLPTAANVALTDRLVVLRQPNINPSVRTINVNNFISSTITGPYSDDANANSAGVPVKGLYYDSDGFVKIRLS